MRSDHRYYQLMLPDFVSGKLGESERRELEAHLSSCDECTRHKSEFSAIAAALREIRPDDPPSHYFSNVLPRIRERIAGTSSRGDNPLVERILVPLAALALLVAVLLQVPFKPEGDLRSVLGGLQSNELAEVEVEQAEYQSLYLIPSTESLASALSDQTINQKLAAAILTDNDDAALVSLSELTDRDVAIILERLGERKIL